MFKCFLLQPDHPSLHVTEGAASISGCGHKMLVGMGCL